MNGLDHTQTFEQHRRYLLGLAYRILGSRAEAEDAVQDSYLRWREADLAAIANPRAWLTTLCTRQCIDLLRAAKRSRLDYVGTWLPEPVHGLEESETERDLATSLSTAFLLLLERLTPKERAAYLLHEIFELPYPEVAAALGVQEFTCRKLVSRARSSVGEERVRHRPSAERQEQLLQAFHQAITAGSGTALIDLLADEVELSADSGGKVPTIRESLHGRAAVLGFIEGALRDYWRDYQWQPTQLNGARGVILRDAAQVVAALSFAFDPAGRVRNIYIMRNPEKLAGLETENGNCRSHS